MFETEPATASPLFELENVVCTPHLGAATTEAQENVALQVAEQISDFLLTGSVTNALNMPSVSAEEAPRLRPYMDLCRLLGAFAGQLTRAQKGRSQRIWSNMRARPPRSTTARWAPPPWPGCSRPVMEGVNMVSAPVLARDHGIEVSEASP